jgi:hypothetical protein
MRSWRARKRHLPGAEGAEFVRQRLCWIEPGEFLMGSPDEETRGLAGADREEKWFEREHPRNAVTLTRGYWLADTATEAMR